MNSPKGAELLDDIETFLGRFVSYPNEHARVAHVLWIAHTHRMDAFESTPRIAFLSPEVASGKTRALELTETLVPRPIHAVSATLAYLFRKIADPDGLPTILYDEIDAVFGPKVKRDNEEIRGLLNAGHRKGAVTGRCITIGNQVSTEEWPAYCPVALAGLGDLPDTLMSRSVVVRMQRRSPNEPIKPWRVRLYAAEAGLLRDRLVTWSKRLKLDAWPELPDGVEDRAADAWEPLLMMADAAGGEWPERARRSAVALVADARRTRTSLGLRLLADIRSVFERDGSSQLLTVDLLKHLNGEDEWPWGNLGEAQLDARILARRLAEYGIRPRDLRHGGSVRKGYRQTDFFDAWQRYLPEPSATAATPQQAKTKDPGDSDFRAF